MREDSYVLAPLPPPPKRGWEQTEFAAHAHSISPEYALEKQQDGVNRAACARLMHVLRQRHGS
jgi:hypothetical protein